MGILKTFSLRLLSKKKLRSSQRTSAHKLQFPHNAMTQQSLKTINLDLFWQSKIHLIILAQQLLAKHPVSQMSIVSSKVAQSVDQSSQMPLTSQLFFKDIPSQPVIWIMVTIRIANFNHVLDWFWHSFFHFQSIPQSVSSVSPATKNCKLEYCSRNLSLLFAWRGCVKINSIN